MNEQHAIVVGAGVGGLGSALALSRLGWRVTLLERDATPMPPDADTAFEWDRRGAPQVRHSHALLARLRNLLRDRYPDVLERLLASGAAEIRFCEMLPETIEDQSVWPGDEDLVALACRRTTFEMVLRQVVSESAGVELRDGVSVNALVEGIRRDDTIPRVAGVQLDGGERLDADLVVAALGRRSAVPRWLDGLGVSVPVTEEETGIVYLSRFYRLIPGTDFPDAAGPIGGDLGYLKYGVFQGDNRTFSVTLAVRTHDDRLRAALLDPEVFDLAARTLPATAPWVEPDTIEAITPVNVMGGLLNRSVTFVDDDGTPLVLGFHAVGDAHTCTNPLYGRGCSLAMVQATLLADAYNRVHDQRTAGAEYESASVREISPWYLAALEQDRLSRMAQANASGGSDPTAETKGSGDGFVDPAAFATEILRDGLVPALQTDAVVFRAFIRTFNLLCAPDTMLADPDVFGRVLQAFQGRESRPPQPSLGPPRSEMLAALGVQR